MAPHAQRPAMQRRRRSTAGAGRPRRLAVLALLLLAAGCLGGGAGGDAGDGGAGDAAAEAAVSFHDGDRELARFDVAVADTPAERDRGLMDRERLGAREGMLFVYPDEATRWFWMRNTSMPLDMVFVAGNGTVVHVAHAAPEPDAPPRRLERYGGVPARYVVEVRRGAANATGIRPGVALRIRGRDGPGASSGDRYISR